MVRLRFSIEKHSTSPSLYFHLCQLAKFLELAISVMTMKRLRRVVVNFHVSLMDNEEDDSNGMNEVAESTRQNAVKEIHELLSSLQGEHPSLGSGWVTSREADLTTRSNDLADATKILSQIRKDISTAAKQSVCAFSSTRPTAMEKRCAHKERAGPNDVGGTQAQSNAAQVSYTQSSIVSPITQAEAQPPVAVPAVDTNPIMSEQQHSTQKNSDTSDDFHDILCYEHNGCVEPNEEYDTDQKDHMAGNEDEVESQIKHNRTTSDDQIASSANSYDYFVQVQSRLDNDSGRVGDIYDVSAPINNQDSEISCLAAIAATPLKAYRRAVITEELSKDNSPPTDLADEHMTLEEMPSPPSSVTAYPIKPPPPPTPTPFAGSFVPKPASYPQFPVSNPSFAYSPKNDNSTQIAFGVESQISDVMMMDHSTNFGYDSTQINEQSYLARTVPDLHLQIHERSNEETRAMKYGDNDDACDSSMQSSLVEDSQSTSSNLADGEPCNINLSNKLWAQQVVANINKKRSTNSKKKAENSHRVSDASAPFPSPSTTIEEGIVTKKIDESNENSSITTDEMSMSVLDTAPDKSLSNLAKKRDPEAGLELAARRARQRLRKQKRDRAQKIREENEKKKRLKALELQAKKLRAQAAYSVKNCLPKQRLKLRPRTRNGRTQPENRQSKLEPEDEDRIKEAKRKTLKRLREKRKKMRETEARRKQMEAKKANEKWRVRDAKLAQDQQRRMQRRRFLEAERKVAAAQMAANAKMLAKVEGLREPKSILKQSNMQTNLGQSSCNHQNMMQKQPPTTNTCNQELEVASIDNVEADVSAVYEDVEAWVKSVYKGGSTSQSETHYSADENKPVGVNCSTRSKERQKPHSQTQIGESESSSSRELQEQQAAEDQAFLDAILQATE